MPSLHSERASRDTEGSRHLPRAARLNLKNVRSQRNAEERRRSIDDPNSAGTDSNLNPQERKLILRILKSNWQAEMRGRETYATLQNEKQIRNGAWLFALLPMQNSGTQIFGLGATAPWGVLRVPSIANQLIEYLIVLAFVPESQDIAKYAKQIEDIGDQPSIAILGQVLDSARTEGGRRISALYSVREQASTRAILRVTPNGRREAPRPLWRFSGQGRSGDLFHPCRVAFYNGARDDR